MISTIRHDEIFNARENNQRITIIGAGATGSRVFAALVELGLTNITVYDFDKVEAHNLANQIYGNKDIGQYKVAGLKEWFELKTHALSQPDGMAFIADKVDRHTKLKGTIFLLTDTMESRREIFEHCIKGNSDVYRVIETRMASTHGNIYTFDPHTRGTDWLNTLVDDEQGEVSACGSSISVGTTASIIANMAVWQFMHAKTNPEAGDEVVNIFLKPLCMSTSKLENSNDQEKAA